MRVGRNRGGGVCPDRPTLYLYPSDSWPRWRVSVNLGSSSSERPLGRSRFASADLFPFYDLQRGKVRRKKGRRDRLPVWVCSLSHPSVTYESGGGRLYHPTLWG